jgi:uncharacterized protein
MKIHYLEIVTPEVDAVCAAYAAAHAVQFGAAEAAFGNARTTVLADGGRLGVRAPMHAGELPVTRPYWLVADIEAAVAAIVLLGGTILVSPMQIAGNGICAIYRHGDIEHGFWQL